MKKCPFDTVLFQAQRFRFAQILNLQLSPLHRISKLVSVPLLVTMTVAEIYTLFVLSIIVISNILSQVSNYKSKIHRNIFYNIRCLFFFFVMLKTLHYLYNQKF